MKRIKITDKIPVGGLDYAIKWIEPKCEEDGAELWGWWRNHPREIEINPDGDDVQHSSTFIHETLHAIDDTYLGNKLTEQDVKSITAGFHQVFEHLGVRFVR